MNDDECMSQPVSHSLPITIKLWNVWNVNRTHTKQSEAEGRLQDGCVWVLWLLMNPRLPNNSNKGCQGKEIKIHIDK